MRGLIVKGIAGFYYVRTEDGSVYQCRARGVFKKDGVTPTVGDRAEISVIDDEEAWVTDILPRRNVFVRPPIANVDCLICVIAAADPAPIRSMTDRLLVTAEKSGVDVILCVNKTDIAPEGLTERIRDVYGEIYDTVFVSAATGDGFDELVKLIGSRTCALSGPSGVGKSSIINRLIPEISAETGSISDKTRRGRHTTRHVEIFETRSGGLIFDTPGFSSLEAPEAEEGELAHLFPEFAPYTGKCRYDNCRHISEPECAVRAAVAEGHISKSRYTSYKEQLAEIAERRKNMY